MKRFSLAFMMMGVLVATTIGAGIFALPWIFNVAGWGAAGILLISLGALVIYAQYLYWRTLDAVGEKERLIGLARTHLGRPWQLLALVGVIGGMFFALIIYLALAERFVALLLPIHGIPALALFWALAVVPMTFGIRRFSAAENGAMVLKAVLILFIFFAAAHPATLLNATAPFVANPLFAFGAILFALAGWNAIEPMYELWSEKGEGAREKKSGQKRPSPLAVVSGGVLVVIVLYILFSFGIIGSLGGGSSLTADTLSGLTTWPAWKLSLLALLGLVALWTSYLPTALEIENALAKDLRWNRTLSFALVALLPLLAVLAGFNNILVAMSFAGAIFAGIQYIVIFVLAIKVLRPAPASAWIMRAAAAVFALAAVYEVAVFVLH